MWVWSNTILNSPDKCHSWYKLKLIFKLIKSEFVWKNITLESSSDYLKLYRNETLHVATLIVPYKLFLAYWNKEVMTTCEHEVGQRTSLTKSFKTVPPNSLTSSLCSPILPMTTPGKLLQYQCVVILLLPFKVHLNRPFAVRNTHIGPIWVKNVASHRFWFFRT